jgi:RNA polymerase sigma-70 factor, ECF subfamily
MDGAGQRVERAARESYGRLLAYLAPRCGIDAAEDALADAFTAALERWPLDGVPAKPEAWLLVAARHRFIDVVRAKARESAFYERLASAARDAQAAFERDDEPSDTRFEMLFACAHPSIAPEMRAPLMLQIVLGIDAARIASAFLVAPAAMSQRLVRSKRKIAGARIPLRVPDREHFLERLDAVLAAIYAAFSTGWNDPLGDAATRDLAEEAIWLARLVVEACPGEPEAIGLLALMLHAHARAAARRDQNGEYVSLDRQDPARWNGRLIEEAESLLLRSAKRRTLGRFQLEAAIQSAYALRRFGREPDRAAIVSLYDLLLGLTGSPVVAINRAVAVSYAAGPSAALALLDSLDGDPRLAQYQPYWAARAELLARAGRTREAHDAYARAIGLTIDPAVRDYLRRRIVPSESSP